MPKVPEDQVKNFNNLVEYLGLCDEIVPTDPTEIIEIVPSEKFNLHSPGVTLQDDEKVALNSRTAHRYVLGENSYQQGVVKLKLELESFQNNDWIFVGMVKGHVPQNGNSCRWRGSYGWSLGSSSCCGVYKDTSFTNDDSVRNLTKQSSDTVQQCDQVFSGEITTSGFINYYIRVKITTVPYFSNFSIFFPYFPQKSWREKIFSENHLLN